MAKRIPKNSRRVRSQQASPALVWRARLHGLWSVMRTLTALAGIAALVGGLFYLAYTGMNTPLEQVQLNARFERVSTLDVEKVLANYKQERFLSVNLQQLQNELKAIAWVDRVEVRKRFPSFLRVSLSEHVAAARWGESGLLNTRGELILEQARYLPPELPQLEGPEGSEWQVAQQYLALHKNVLRYGLNVKYLGMDARGAWRFDLSNGTQVHIGREATDQRFHRFSHRVLPMLFELSQTASVIDMRYSNGFAVKWQNGSAESAGSASSSASSTGTGINNTTDTDMFSRAGLSPMHKRGNDLSGNTFYAQTQLGESSYV